jgi:diacylglycerol kinase family enzyme
MTGRWPEYLQQEYPNLIQGGRLKVSPFDILVDYDVVNKDGTMSIAQNAQIWSNLFQTIAQQPLLLQRFDIVKIFKMIAKGMGAKNVDEFELKQMPAMQAQVMPDENVMREAEKGNLIPLEGGTNVPAVQS